MEVHLLIKCNVILVLSVLKMHRTNHIKCKELDLDISALNYF